MFYMRLVENGMPSENSQEGTLMVNPVDCPLHFSDTNLHKELLLMAWNTAVVE